MRRRRVRGLLSTSLAALVGFALAAGATPTAAQTALDPSNVVLVFDVSNSILLSDDGTNVEFADALTGIADRVEASAEELAIGNAEISFVVFGRGAIVYPSGCDRLALHEDPAAVAQLAACLRSIAAEYRAGVDAPIRDRINTADTDHVAALRRAAQLLPNLSTRSAVIFFTDGEHDPPGTNRDDEDVVAAIAGAYEGRSPLAILPVGLGARAGAFESQLRAIFDAYFRDMEPCEGRASFAWPEVVFQAADQAGIAVASALQEVTCSYTFVPPPTAAPPTPTPSPTPPPPDGPLSVQLLAGDRSVTVQWQPPQSGADEVIDYLVACRPVGGADADWRESTEGVSTEVQAVVSGLSPGVAYECRVAAVGPSGTSEPTLSAETVTVLGIPGVPGQPRVEPRDRGALVTVDPIVGGAPIERYVVQCTGSAGGPPAIAANAMPPIEVGGLTNGDTVTCVVYTENRVGRSAASVASAAFSPCAGLDCNPVLGYGLIAAAVAVGLALAAYGVLAYRRRNRVWVTAQVDGGANLPLGWGPEIGIRLVRGDDGWFATAQPPAESRIRVRHLRRAWFAVTSRTGTRDVHQGNPTPVRDEDGSLHQLILREYRSRPREGAVATPVETKAGDELGTRIEGQEERPEPEAPKDDWVG